MTRVHDLTCAGRAAQGSALLAAALFVVAGCSTGAEKSPERFAGPDLRMIQSALTPGCGNGVLEPELGETCDDGNVVSGDGCSSACEAETGFVCVGERPSVCSAPDYGDAPASFGQAAHSRSLPPVSPFTGKDFWTGFPVNLGPPSYLAFKIAGDPGTNVVVENAAGAQITSLALPAGGIATVNVDVTTYQITNKTATTQQGVHVTADAEIRVLATSEHPASTDTWALWSTDKLGSRYSLMGVNGTGSWGEQVLLVGVADGTSVQVRDPSATLVADLVLNAGDTWLRGFPTLAGYTVTADHPVAVIGGTECDNLPGTACDLTAEQLAPTRNWARDYAIAPTFDSTTASAKHAVFAGSDDTSIVVTRSDGQIQNLSLNKGESQVFADMSSGGAVYGYFVSADKPIAVESLIADPGHTWDPSLVFWPPVDGYVDQTKMPTSGKAVVYTNFLSLITRTSAADYVSVNGTPVTGWQPIASTGYSFAQVQVPEGDNAVTATGGVKFAAVAVGGSSSVSYGYASPYDIATVGGTTNCYLGTTAPDYEPPFAGSAAADEDDLAGVDDEDAFPGRPSVHLGDASVSLTVPCNDNYFGTDVTATVYGFVDFDRDGAFAANEEASAGCDDVSPDFDGTATLTWNAPAWSDVGDAILRLRICDNTADCSAPTGEANSGEVEDYLAHVGTCGDAYVDTFEGCDDGNGASGDGCSDACAVEAGFSCSGSPSVCLVDTAPAIASPTSGALLTTATPTVSGTCIDGAAVRVLEGASVLCSATCAGGAFSCASSALADGAHALTADQRVGGFTSVPSAPVTVNVDTMPPAAPTLDAPADGSVLSQSAPTFSGACEAGASVRISNGGVAVCTTPCAPDGTYACVPAALADGTYAFSATQTDVGGNASPASAAASVVLDTSAPAAPILSAPSNGSTVTDATPTFTGTCETGAVVRVLEGLTPLCSATCAAGAFSCVSAPLANGDYGVAPRQKDAAGNDSPFGALTAFTVASPPPTPVFQAPAAGALLATSTPTLEVTCTAGDTVHVYEGATELCAGACAGGTYGCTPTLADGAHSVFANQADAVLTSADSAARSFRVDTTPPGAPAIGDPADGAWLDGGSGPVSGTCDADSAQVSVFEGATRVCSGPCDAGTFTCDAVGVADGDHTVFARATDAAGNVGADGAPITVHIDSVAPAAPALTAPAPDLLTNDATPAFAGHCETDATVEVFEGATILCSATCAAGAFTCTSAGLPDGGHVVAARQRDRAGNVSPASTAQTLTVDATPPAAVGLVAPADDAWLDASSVSARGTCEDGAAVDVRDAGLVVCSTTCAAGAFTCDVTGLGDGDHVLDASQTDPAGNAGPAGPAVTIHVDTAAPAAPAILAPTDGAFVATAAPQVSGACETAASVDVLEGGAVLCSATCAAGAFSCTSSDLADGAHALFARQADRAGNVGPDGATVSFTVDTAPPAAPILSAPSDGALLATATPDLSGSCETDATVQVLEGGAVLCSAPCAAGAFSCASSDLADGAHAVFARQLDRAGNQSADGAAVSFSVDTTPPAAPTVAAPPDGAFVATATPQVSGACETAATVDVLEGGAVLCSATCLAGAYACASPELADGDHAIVARQTDRAGNVGPDGAAVSFTVDTVAPDAPAVSAPVDGDLLATSVVRVSGLCEADASVDVLEGTAVLCSATCGAGSFWCDAADLADGAHAISARQTDRAGNVGPKGAAVSFTVDTTPPAAPTVGAPTDGAYAATATPTVSGACETGASVEVREGAATLCSVTCAAGAFSCATSNLGDGAHAVYARQTDPAGNRSPDGGPVSFTVDTAAPAAPAVTAPEEAAYLATSTPTVSGACETDAAVEVLEGTSVQCQATCAAGAFSCDAPALTDGVHAVFARQTDLAGNVSADGAAVTFTVDTTPPAAPSVTAPAEGAFVATATPAISGACETDAMVDVLEGATVLCSIPCADGAFTCASSELADGAHAVFARQTDRAGNLGADGAAVTFTVDTTPPAAPAIAAPAGGDHLATATPAISGTCETDAAVELVEGTTVLCSARCADGAFECAPSALADGVHDLVPRQADRAGNQSPDGPAVSFTVDTAAPAAPAISSPADGAFLATATPTLSGSCESDATVEVLEGTEALCSATCAAGAFSCAPAALADGVHAAFPRQTDLAGNVSADGAVVSFTVDTLSPDAPSIAAPAADALLATATPTVSGACETDARVEVVEGTAVLCSATCAGGAFACASSELADGAHALAARQTDRAGNGGPESRPVPVTVDTTAPEAPVLSAPAADAFLATDTPAVSGACETDATVEVLEGTEVLCSATCAAGAFACETSALADGAHAVLARQTDPAGNRSADGPASSFTVDTAPPDAPVLTVPADGDLLATATPDHEGTCESGAQVDVVEGEAVLCTATCADGAFACASASLAEGEHAVLARQTDPAGNVSPDGAPVSFTVDTVAPAAPPITSPVEGERTADATPAVSGTCEAGASVEVLEGAEVVCTADCVDGAFACDAAFLPDGDHALAAVQTDPAGNRSEAGPAVTFTVDTTAPAVPTLVHPDAGALLADPRPTFAGRAVPESTVTVHVDGRVACEARVDEAGLWSCAPTAGLADGPHAAQADAADDLGNTSALSAVLTFSIDTVPPDVPSLLVPAEGQVVGHTPTFAGLAEAGARVTVEIDGAVGCAATADAEGAFACVSWDPLGTGDHAAVVRAVDAAGNRSADSGPRAFAVEDGGLPGAPVVLEPTPDAVLDVATPHFTGRAERGTEVTLSVDGARACAVPVSPSGVFGCTSALSLPDGVHTVSGVAASAAGKSGPSVPVRFVVDTRAPAAPILDRPEDGATTSASPVLAGRAEAGASVAVTVDGAVVCAAAAGPDGGFACVPDAPLSAGAHTASAAAFDAAGHASPPSAAVPFTVTADAPPVAVVTAPEDGAHLQRAAVVFVGRADPASRVTLSLDGAAACEARVGPSGGWTCTVEDVADGGHRATAVAATEVATGAPSPAVDFTLDTTAPAAPELVRPADGATTGPWPRFEGNAEAGASVRVQVDERLVCTTRAADDGAFACVGFAPLVEGAHGALAEAVDAAGHRSGPSGLHAFTVSVDAPVILAPADDALLGEARPIFGGSAQPGDAVRVVVDGEGVCTAVAGPDGAWSCTPAEPLADGAHVVGAVADDGYGTVQQTADRTLVVDTTAPGVPSVAGPAEGETVYGGTVELTGTAEAGSVVTVRVDGETACEAVAGADGAWACTAEVPGGAHRASATAMDAAGNASPASADRAFTAVAQLPAPRIEAPTDGAVLEAGAVEVAGVAEPGSAVTVTDDLGVALCRTAADEAGAFSCTANPAMGERTVTAVAELAGLVSPASEPVSFTVLGPSSFAGGGCGCVAGGAGASGAGLPVLLALAGLLARRRRRRG